MNGAFWWGITQGWGKNCLKGVEGTILGTHIGLEIVCVSTGQSEELLKSGHSSWSPLKGLASVVGADSA